MKTQNQQMDPIAPETKDLILKICRDSLVSILNHQPFIEYESAVYQTLEKTLPANVEGVFVTLFKWHQLQSELRGCIGHFSRQESTWVKELQDVTYLSAMEDPRFKPMQKEELPFIKIEVSLLEKPEDIESEKDLDPHKYGVIVKSGFRTATLLPHIEGINTVSRQLELVRKKAGICPHESVQMQRYFVFKIVEE